MRFQLLQPLKNAAARLTNKFRQTATFIKQSRRAVTLFFLAASLPGLLVLILFVIFPTRANKTPDIQAAEPTQQKAAPSPQQKAAPAEKPDFAPVDPQTRLLMEETTRSIISLQAERSYYQALLEMAKSDTFSLSLNLRDSTLDLLIKGVAVRTCKILDLKRSKAFDLIRNQALLDDYNAKPFVLQRDFATIKKIPIKVIQAPKDTTEAYETMNQALRMEQPDVYCRLYFNKNLVIDIDQTKRPSFSGFLARIGYWFRWKFYTVNENVKSLLQIKRPSHPMLIQLKLEENDAKAIYRSLQGNVRLALLI